MEYHRHNANNRHRPSRQHHPLCLFPKSSTSILIARKIPSLFYPSLASLICIFVHSVALLISFISLQFQPSSVSLPCIVPDPLGRTRLWRESARHVHGHLPPQLRPRNHSDHFEISSIAIYQRLPLATTFSCNCTLTTHNNFSPRLQATTPTSDLQYELISTHFVAPRPAAPAAMASPLPTSAMGAGWNGNAHQQQMLPSEPDHNGVQLRPMGCRFPPASQQLPTAS